MTEKTTLQVEGMTCANCAQTITRLLQKKGAADVYVSFTTGEVEFTGDALRLSEYVDGINELGYKVVEQTTEESRQPKPAKPDRYFFIAAVLTLPLLAHMVSSLPLLHNPWFQLGCSLPVLLLGYFCFGRSAVGSVKALDPNMDVLILMGSTMAFAYSLAGFVMNYGTAEVHRYLFFETSAAIICFVLLGNLIESRVIRQTSAALDALINLQPVRARKIVNWSREDERIIEVQARELAQFDLVLVTDGGQIPADGKIFEGSAWIDESMLTGEPVPVSKTVNDQVFAGTVIKSGSVRMFVEKTGRQSLLSNIIELVKKAQQYKPPIQKLGDAISRWFVPAVILTAVITLMVNHYVVSVSWIDSVMRAIAVLVIACPCAMGLATPTALSAGIGKAASQGILIRGGNYLELLSKAGIFVFDKTGTLTTGIFRVTAIDIFRSALRQEIISAIYALEQHSTHPLAASIIQEIEKKSGKPGILKFKRIHETKGMGIEGLDEKGRRWLLGSQRFVKDTAHAGYDVYLSLNDETVAAIRAEDEVNSQAYGIISALKENGIKTVLLSGDKKEKCERIGKELGIDAVYPEKMPEEKTEIIQELKKQGITVMTGDGINDAAALASADVSVSFGHASAVAIHASHVVILRRHELKEILTALTISRNTLRTIKQNLFWAFFYNVLAIPIAAAGYLAPVVASLSMAFSDVIVIGNSVRLRFSRIKKP